MLKEEANKPSKANKEVINSLTLNPKLKQCAIATNTGFELIDYTTREKIIRGKFQQL